MIMLSDKYLLQSSTFLFQRPHKHKIVFLLLSARGKFLGAHIDAKIDVKSVVNMAPKF